YTTMSEHLIDTQLTHSPFFFASANQSMLGCGVAHAFQQATLETCHFRAENASRFWQVPLKFPYLAFA
ncbi:hypothetical protein, partial [Vibrio cholerae]|uniref:hypothetical protein n=1 Tax=Vibrio cholerae TaxID=666 RepID=UPI003B5159B0